MGKRKSSPRLATTSSNDVVTYIISKLHLNIHLDKLILKPFFRIIMIGYFHTIW